VPPARADRSCFRGQTDRGLYNGRAGAIGTMEVRIKGDLPAGTYETVLTFVGRNYCPVTVPLTIHIGDQPPADADGGTE
jgi:hypothetical protein